jgi:hypothetical protein
MIVPSLVPFVAGERVPAAKLNANTVTALSFLMYKPVCHMWHNTVQSFTSSTTATQVNLNTVLTDTDGMANTAANRVDIWTPGLYRINVQMAFSTNASGVRYAAITRNGTTQILAANATPALPLSYATRVHVASAVVRLNYADDIRMIASQNSGVSLNTVTDSNGCFLSVEWVGA